MAKQNNERETAAVAALWKMEQRSSAGQRPALTLADILAASLDIADSSGLGELSMAKLARRLGFSTMALYRHVPNKGELLTLLFDAGVGTPPTSIRAASGWRAKMHALADAYLDVFLRRPWLLDIPITGPPQGPNNVRWLDTGLSILTETGIDAEDRVQTFVAITSYLLGSVRLYVEIDRARAVAQRGGESTGDAAYGDALLRLMPPGQFPAVEAAIASGVFDEDDGDERAEMQHGLDLLLDGIEKLIERRGLILDR